MFHSSVPASKGRKTQLAPERVLRWRTNLSKKAKRRRRNQMRSSRTTERIVPVEVQERTADEFAADTADNALLADLLLHKQMPELRKTERLVREDADELLLALEEGSAESSIATWDRALRALGAQGRFEEAVAVVQRVRSLGMIPQESTFNALIGACGSQQNVEAAMAVVEVMREQGLEPTERTYGALMHACVQGGDVPRAFALLAEAERDEVELNNVHFTTLMTGLLRANDPNRVFEVFDHMQRHHCDPDQGSYSAVITACGRTDQVERAERILEDMLEQARRPNRVVWNSLLHACGRSLRHAAKTHRYFSQMQASGFVPDLYSYRAALLACTHEGDTVRAREYMEKMASAGVSPDADTANVLLAVYSRAVDPTLARRVKYRREGLQPHGEQTEGERAKANEGSALMELADTAEAEARGEGVPWWEDPSKVPERGMFEMPGDRVGLAKVAQRVLAHHYDKKAAVQGGQIPVEGKAMAEQAMASDSDADAADVAKYDTDAQPLTQQELLELPEHREWRETLIAAGIEREHLEDLEFEIVNGRPDTEGEGYDPQEVGVLRRRARRTREMALAQNLERVVQRLPFAQSEMRRRERNRHLKQVGAAGYESATTSEGEGTRERLTEAASEMLGVSRGVVEGTAARNIAAGMREAEEAGETARYSRAVRAIAAGKTRATPDDQVSEEDWRRAVRALSLAAGRVGLQSLAGLGLSPQMARLMEQEASSIAAEADGSALLPKLVEGSDGEMRPPETGEEKAAVAVAAEHAAAIAELRRLPGVLPLPEAERLQMQADADAGIHRRTALGGVIRELADGTEVLEDDGAAVGLATMPGLPGAEVPVTMRDVDETLRPPPPQFGPEVAGPMHRAMEASARLPPGVLPGQVITQQTLERAAEDAAAEAEMAYLQDPGAPGNAPPAAGAFGMEHAAKAAGAAAAERVLARGVAGLREDLAEAERAMAEADEAETARATPEASAAPLDPDSPNVMLLRVLAGSPVPAGHPEQQMLRRLQLVTRAALAASGINWKEDVAAAAMRAKARVPAAFLERLQEQSVASRTNIFSSAGALPGTTALYLPTEGVSAAHTKATGDGSGGGSRGKRPEASVGASDEAKASAAKSELRQLLRKATGFDLDRPFGLDAGSDAFRFASALTKVAILEHGESDANDDGGLDRLRIGNRSARDFVSGADDELDPKIDIASLGSDADTEGVLGAYEAGELQRSIAASISVLPAPSSLLGLAGSSKFLGGRIASSAQSGVDGHRVNNLQSVIATGLGDGVDHHSDGGQLDDPFASDGVMVPALALSETESELEEAARDMEAGVDLSTAAARAANAARKRDSAVPMRRRLEQHMLRLSPRARQTLTDALQRSSHLGEVWPLMDDAVLPTLPRFFRKALRASLDRAADQTSTRVHPDGHIEAEELTGLSSLAAWAGLQQAAELAAGAPSPQQAAIDAATAPVVPQSIYAAFEAVKKAQRARPASPGGSEAEAGGSSASDGGTDGPVPDLEDVTRPHTVEQATRLHVRAGIEAAAASRGMEQSITRAVEAHNSAVALAEEAKASGNAEAAELASKLPAAAGARLLRLVREGAEAGMPEVADKLVEGTMRLDRGEGAPTWDVFASSSAMPADPQALARLEAALSAPLPGEEAAPLVVEGAAAPVQPRGRRKRRLVAADPRAAPQRKPQVASTGAVSTGADTGAATESAGWRSAAEHSTGQEAVAPQPHEAEVAAAAAGQTHEDFTDAAGDDGDAALAVEPGLDLAEQRIRALRTLRREQAQLRGRPAGATAMPSPPAFAGGPLYRGYDPCHVVDDRGAVWEPIASHGSPTPPGMVRRRRSGLAIRGRTHLPRPLAMHRLGDTMVRSSLQLSPAVAEAASQRIPADRVLAAEFLLSLKRAVAAAEADAGMEEGQGGSSLPDRAWNAAAAVLGGGGGLGDADDTDPVVHARAAAAAAADSGQRPTGQGHDHGLPGEAALGMPLVAGVPAQPRVGPRPRGAPQTSSAADKAPGATAPLQPHELLPRPRSMPRTVSPSAVLAAFRGDPSLSVAPGTDEAKLDLTARAIAAARRGEKADSSDGTELRSARMNETSDGDGSGSVADRLRSKMRGGVSPTTRSLATILRPNPAQGQFAGLSTAEQLELLGQADLPYKLLHDQAAVGRIPGAGQLGAEAAAAAEEESLRQRRDGPPPAWSQVAAGREGSHDTLSGDDSLSDEAWTGGAVGGASLDGMDGGELSARAEDMLLRAAEGTVELSHAETAALHALIDREREAAAKEEGGVADRVFEEYRAGLDGVAATAEGRGASLGIGRGLGPVERALVAATESMQQRRKRLQEGGEPTLMEVLLAVRALEKGTVDAAHLYKDRATGEWASQLFEEVGGASAERHMPGADTSAASAHRVRPTRLQIAMAAASPETAAVLLAHEAESLPAATGVRASTAQDAVERARERLLLYAATGESDPVRAEAVLRGERLPSPAIRAPVGGGDMHGTAHESAMAQVDAAGRGTDSALSLLTDGASLALLDGNRAIEATSSGRATDAEPMTDADAAEDQARRLVERLGGDGEAMAVEGASFAPSDTVERMLQVGETAGLLSRHGKRVKRAREALARMVAPGRPGELRLRALQDMSQRVLGGMQWFPRELPKDKLMARLALVEEAERVYARLYSHGLAPGAGVWLGAGVRGSEEADGEAGPPTVVTLNTMVNIYCTAGLPARAYEFLQAEYPRWGITPDERSLRPLVGAHAKMRRMDLAEEVVGLMLELGMQPGADSWGPLAHGYARQWQLSDAVGVIQEMERRGIECPERWASLTRIRLRDLGVWHRDVPQHPIAWQYSKSVMDKRFDKTKRVRKNRRFTLGYDRKARQRISL